MEIVERVWRLGWHAVNNNIRTLEPPGATLNVRILLSTAWVVGGSHGCVLDYMAVVEE